MGAQVRIVPEVFERLFHQPATDLHTDLRQPCWRAPRSREQQPLQPRCISGTVEKSPRGSIALYASIIAIPSHWILNSRSNCGQFNHRGLYGGYRADLENKKPTPFL